MPYQTLPDIQSSSLLSGVDQNGYVLMSSSTGIVINTDVRSTLTVSSLLQTSESAYSKPDWQNLATWDMEDGDLAGPFSLGAWASETVDEAAQAGYFTQSQARLVTEDGAGYVLKFKGMELLGELKGLFQ